MSTTPGTPRVRIDEDALHRILWRRTDRFDRLRLTVTELAGELDLGYCNLTTHITAMTRDGRLRKIGGKKNGVKTFVVVDPVVWKAEQEAPKAS